MNYLNLDDDRIYILKILEDKITPRTYHWLGGKSVTCMGEGCLQCLQGQGKRYEGWLDVESYGWPLRWSFPASVGVKIKDVCPRLLDAVISVKKSRGAGGDHWDITRVLVEPEQELTSVPASPLKPYLLLMADTLVSMAKELRSQADMLGGDK